MSLPRILLVEDSVVDKELFEYLCGGRYDIIWARTLTEAKAVLTSGAVFSCLIVDLKLPDSEFPGTIDEIKKLNDKPLVVLTGTDEKELIVGKASLSKVHKYLLKYRDNTREAIREAIDGAINVETKS